MLGSPESLTRNSFVAFMLGPLWVPLADLLANYHSLFWGGHIVPYAVPLVAEEVTAIAVIAYVGSLLLGLPVFLILRARHQLTPLRAAMLGAVLGPLTVFVFVVLAMQAMHHM